MLGFARSLQGDLTWRGRVNLPQNKGCGGLDNQRLSQPGLDLIVIIAIYLTIVLRRQLFHLPFIGLRLGYGAWTAFKSYTISTSTLW